MRRIPLPYLLGASGWVVLAATMLPAVLTPLRTPLAVGFLLLCPGAAALRLTRRRAPGRGGGPLETLVLSVAFSVVLDTLVAEACFFTRQAGTFRVVTALAVLTTLLTLLNREWRTSS